MPSENRCFVDQKGDCFHLDAFRQIVLSVLNQPLIDLLCFGLTGVKIKQILLLQEMLLDMIIEAIVRSLVVGHCISVLAFLTIKQLVLKTLGAQWKSANKIRKMIGNTHSV